MTEFVDGGLVASGQLGRMRFPPALRVVAQMAGMAAKAAKAVTRERPVSRVD